MNRSQRRTQLRWLVALVTVVALGGCGGNDDAQPEPTLTSVDSTTPTNQSTGPAPDPGGNETSVSLPSAPVGGQSSQSGSDPAVECLPVNWLAGDDATIPEGASVTLGGFSFDPPVLEVASGGCESEGQQCDGFAFTSSDLACSLPLQLNGTSFDPGTTEASASVDATASCDEETSGCTAFLAAVVEQSPAQLSVTLPQNGETTNTEPTEEITSTGPTETSATD